jgi:hypothetical protein
VYEYLRLYCVSKKRMVSRMPKNMKKNDHAPLMISIMYMLYRKTFVVVVVPFIPAFHHYISFL